MTAEQFIIPLADDSSSDDKASGSNCLSGSSSEVQEVEND
jgi:hypothetical protein